jgi:tRNA threonylcarbamoyladenosine biosynthesis protein TsaB
MRILALDTTTRGGSVALVDHDALVAVESGDATRTHGERLPGDIMRLLASHHVSLSEIDLFAVAAGPGSFTGLRIGIATMQGLATAHQKGLIGVSTLDALAESARRQLSAGSTTPCDTIAAWMDAQRGEVFAALYSSAELSMLEGPLVARPDEILTRWTPGISQACFVGDGAVTHRRLLARYIVLEPTPLLAPAIGWMAAEMVRSGPIPGPDAIRPLYVRRPDAELARARSTSGQIDDP